MSSPRLDALTSWHADWRGLRVAVLGLSVTGFSVADTLAELGADVMVFTESADPDPTNLSLGTLELNAFRAKRAYRSKLAQYKLETSESALGRWEMDKFDRTY